MIGVIDYGLGNVEAFLNVYHRLHIPCMRLTDSTMFNEVERLILPGVGSFDWAMQRLSESGMKETLNRNVLKNKKPVLGVCVGMQMMAKGSTEGQLSGLGWINVEVKDFHNDVGKFDHPVPHMGWNTVTPKERSGLFFDMDFSNRFYFLHSFYFPFQTNHSLASSEYGIKFACAVRSGNAFGVQFHPEKSHASGMKLLKNFATQIL